MTIDQSEVLFGRKIAEPCSISSKSSKSSKRQASLSVETPFEKRHRQAHDYNTDSKFSFCSSGWTCVNQTNPKREGGDGGQEISPRSSSSDEQSQMLTPTSSSGGAETHRKYPAVEDIDGLRIQWLLDGKRQKFNAQQEKTICLWMKENNARVMGKHRVAFNELLERLGFLNPAYSDKVRCLLHIKVRNRVARIGHDMEETGAITVLQKALANETLSFAKWSDTWLSTEWDGSIAMPDYWCNQGERDSTPMEPEVFVVEESPGMLQKYTEEEHDEEDFFEEEELNNVDEVEEAMGDNTARTSEISSPAGTLPIELPNTPDSQQLHAAPKTPSSKARFRIILNFPPRAKIMDTKTNTEAEAEDAIESYDEDKDEGETIGEDEEESEDEEEDKEEEEEVSQDESVSDGQSSVVEDHYQESPNKSEHSKNAVSDTSGSNIPETPPPRPLRIQIPHRLISSPDVPKAGDYVQTRRSFLQNSMQPFAVMEIDSPEALNQWKMQIRAILLTQNVWDVVTGQHTEPVLSISPLRHVPRNNLTFSTPPAGNSRLHLDPRDSDSSTASAASQTAYDVVNVQEMQYDEEPILFRQQLKEWHSARQVALGWMLLTMGEKTRAAVQVFENGREIQDPRVLMAWLQKKTMGGGGSIQDGMAAISNGFR